VTIPDLRSSVKNAAARPGHVLQHIGLQHMGLQHMSALAALPDHRHVIVAAIDGSSRR
jgi:hypothetical protein